MNLCGQDAATVSGAELKQRDIRFIYLQILECGPQLSTKNFQRKSIS